MSQKLPDILASLFSSEESGEINQQMLTAFAGRFLKGLKDRLVPEEQARLDKVIYDGKADEINQFLDDHRVSVIAAAQEVKQKIAVELGQEIGRDSK